MSAQVPMKTLSQVMAVLAKRGIHREFRMNEQGEMKLQDRDKIYLATDLKIIKSYRFEGDSNPDDNAVLYVVMDSERNQGIIIDSYGVDSNYEGDSFDQFMREIPVEEDDNFTIE